MTLSLTHVAYTEGDALGHAAAFVTLLPISRAFSSGPGCSRAASCCGIVVGYVANAALCDQLKHLYQPRPTGATLTDYGMPSNHSQTTCFLLAYALCFIFGGAVVSHARLWERSPRRRRLWRRSRSRYRASTWASTRRRR